MTDHRKQAEALLSRMTLEEKAAQMIQIPANLFTDEEAEAWAQKGVGSFLHTLGERAAKLQKIATGNRLGIPVLFGIDAVRGHALNHKATVFPSPLAMACTWDTEALEAVGRATGAEVALDGLHWTFAPLLCVARDLRWGRVDETFGESPMLIGELAAAMIKGLQGDDLSDDDAILACAKHYIAYAESTGGRDSVDTPVTLRMIRETFLPPYQKAVDAGCATMMTAYLPVDGVPMTAHKELLTDILKDELGFDGFVVTDWDNVGSLVKRQNYAKTIQDAACIAAKAGNDMFMSTPEAYDALIALVKNGRLSQAVLDEAVRRILAVKFRLGLFDGKQKPKTVDMQAHRALNESIQENAIVLLKNNGALPLQSKKLAVVGPSADHIHAMLGDWTYMSHPGIRHGQEIEHKIIPVTPRKGLEQLADSHGLTVAYEKGCGFLNSRKDLDQHSIDGHSTLETLILPEIQPLNRDAVLAACRDADVLVACVGDFLAQTGEFRDRGNLDLSGDQQTLLELLKSTGKPLVVVLVSGKPLTVPWVSENADAVVQLFNGGQTAGLALAKALTGETNTFGKLPISFAHHTGQLPVYHNHYPGWHGGQYVDMPATPLYAFGYGLSYTAYRYGAPQLTRENGEILVSVNVQNTGSVDGTEIVQLYAHRPAGERMTPVKELIDFARVPLQAGEIMTVEFIVDMESLKAVHGDGSRVLEPGEYTLMTGPSSRGEDLQTVTLTL
ncbi:MAG TPA: glycoside hydrolase family 3 N-terminal domain-containing protein [Candidatus Limiplasma sp.]|nr:glycoside hydrolase family 3 N-terminal domain-containing protein [Candidatus Limiplasma sp.]